MFDVKEFDIKKLNGRPLRLLIGGSPCTYWSIACSSNKREVEASGLGWELFKNYLIAKEKFKPDFFLYENNKSASNAIKKQISDELGVEIQYINSSLVSAQNRERFYAHNIPNVGQPEDRNILFKDVIETHNNVKMLSEKEMDYMVRATKDGRNHFDFGYMHINYNDKSKCLLANLYKGVPYNVLCVNVSEDKNYKEYFEEKLLSEFAQYNKENNIEVVLLEGTKNVVYGAAMIAVQSAIEGIEV